MLTGGCAPALSLRQAQAPASLVYPAQLGLDAVRALIAVATRENGNGSNGGSAQAVAE